MYEERMEELRQDVMKIKGKLIKLIDKYNFTGLRMMNEDGKYILRFFVLFEDIRETQQNGIEKV